MLLVFLPATLPSEACSHQFRNCPRHLAFRLIHSFQLPRYISGHLSELINLQSYIKPPKKNNKPLLKKKKKKKNSRHFFFSFLILWADRMKNDPYFRRNPLRNCMSLNPNVVTFGKFFLSHTKSAEVCRSLWNKNRYTFSKRRQPPRAGKQVKKKKVCFWSRSRITPYWFALVNTIL